MWSCPICGLDGNADGEIQCPGCGFSKISYPQLSGDAGEFILHTNLVFGQKNLTTLVGDEAKYAEVRQFELRKEGESWRIYGFSARNITVLNGVAIPREGMDLHDGDEIAIASRKDFATRVACITIGLIH